MTKRTKYGESTVLVSIRVPESKKEEIINRFYSVLNDYIIENPFTWKDGNVDSEVVLKSDLKPAEKKSNPADDTLKASRDVEVGFRYVDELGHWQSCGSGVLKFEKLQSLPWTTLVQSYNSKGAIRNGENDDFYTKRTHNGKLEILKHENYASAVIYANENFK